MKEKIYKILPLLLTAALICGLSFYLGFSFGSDKTRVVEEILERQGVSADVVNKNTESQTKCGITFKQEKFPECNITQQDLTPCTDPQRWRKFDRRRMAFRERHCPPPSQRLQCLIPPPEGYQIPIKWPKSLNECWYKNVPYEWINVAKSNQNWLHKSGEKFLFPGGGTMFPNGVGEYLDQMENLIPGMKDGSIRTALDTGCGVASWGGYLLERGIITMSLAPRDNHEAQVQFALERGIPAILGVLSTQRLPFPANAFDIAHCSRCLIPWTVLDGAFLLEVDRVIRPGGYWVLSGPPVNYEVHWHGWNSTKEKEKADLDALQDLLSRMCYKLHAMEGDIAVWQKPIDNSCYSKRDALTNPPICDDSIETDAAWYIPMRPCIVPQPEALKGIGVGQLLPWPERLVTPSDRVRFFSGGSSGGFKSDTRMWKKRVQQYKKVLPQLGTDSIRNVMDMNTKYGSFAAALIDDPVWVMNVVSSYGVNSLGIIYDRGLIGTLNDWCEAFSTYPRTYDLLHVAGLFSGESQRCEMKFVMLEMDRILRPKGYVIVADTPDFLEKAAVIGEAMRWKCHRAETEAGLSTDTDALLICQKEFWRSSELE